MDIVRKDLGERGIQLSTAYGKTKNREVWGNIRASLSASWWKRRKKIDILCTDILMSPKVLRAAQK